MSDNTIFSFLNFSEDAIADAKTIFAKEVPAGYFKTNWDLVADVSENDILSTLSMSFKQNVNASFLFHVNEVVENCAKYASSDTDIRFELKRIGDQALFIVENVSDKENIDRLKATLTKIQAALDSGKSVSEIVKDKYDEIDRGEMFADHIGLYMLLLNSSDPFKFDVKSLDDGRYTLAVTMVFRLDGDETIVEQSNLAVHYKKESATLVFVGKFNLDKPDYPVIFEQIDKQLEDSPNVITLSMGACELMNSGAATELSRCIRRLLRNEKQIVIKINPEFKWQPLTFDMFGMISDNVKIEMA